MEQDSPDLTPPVISAASRPARRWGWWVHLLLLASYPLVLGMAPLLRGQQPEEGGTLLPTEMAPLISAMGFELFIFAVVFSIAWLASRANADELRLDWRGGAAPVWRGLIYSVALRLLIAVVVVAIAIAAVAFQGGSQEAIEKLRPKSEVVVDSQALVNNPLYLLLSLTFISFVVAGLREELWRAGVLAGFQRLFPDIFASRRGQLMAVGIAAIIFGLGHYPQGWGGAGMTALLGFGLGWVMIRHNSIWEAVFAHGFFNATSFGMLYFVARYQPGLIPGT